MTWDPATIAAVTCLGLGLAILGGVLWRRRLTPLEKERRRRLLIHRTGRIIDARVTDVQGDTVFFSYEVHGVAYSTSQDITALVGLIPPDRGTLLGAAACKYQRANPANSIVLCEEWNGFHRNPLPSERK